MDIRENYNFWCTSPYFDEDTKAELKSISDNEEEICLLYTSSLKIIICQSGDIHRIQSLTAMIFQAPTVFSTVLLYLLKMDLQVYSDVTANV